MDKEMLRRLELLNQLSLSDSEKDEIISFFDKREEDLKKLDSIDTSSVERMVHVMPIMTVVREDKVVKSFTREQLQAGAPETMDGYWQVPRVVE